MSKVTDDKDWDRLQQDLFKLTIWSLEWPMYYQSYAYL